MHTDNIWLENATESAWEVVESDHLRNPNSHCGEGGWNYPAGLAQF